MSTFLELGQKMHREVGMAGALSTMQSQTGMLRRLVGYIADADLRIQKKRIDWNFLWAPWTVTLVDTIKEYSPPDLLGTFDQNSFWIDSGTDDAYQLNYVEYRKYQRSVKHLSVDDDTIDLITVLPNKQVTVYPPPNTASAGKIISCDYWKRPVKMTADAAESLIPEEFEDIILWRAKMFYFAFRHNNGAHDDAEIEYIRLLKQLEAHSLPERENDGLSRASEPLVIMVS